MRFQVPQFINIEDKVIGPLTIKQFLYIIVAVVVLFILYKLLNLFVFIILSIPVIALTYALTFLKIRNQPFINIIKNMFSFLRKPDFYVWKKLNPKEEKQEEAPKIIKKAPAKKKKKHLRDISWRINVEK